jgi:tetratricopeptide (TPR) repeat protein
MGPALGWVAVGCDMGTAGEPVRAIAWNILAMPETPPHCSAVRLAHVAALFTFCAALAVSSLSLMLLLRAPAAQSIVLVAAWYFLRRACVGRLGRDIAFSMDLDTFKDGSKGSRRRLGELEGRLRAVDGSAAVTINTRIEEFRRAATARRKGRQPPSPLMKWFVIPPAVAGLLVFMVALLRPRSLSEAGQAYEAATVASMVDVGDYSGIADLVQESKVGEAGAIYNAGLAFLNQGRLDEAAKHFGRAITINPYYADAHYNIGQIELRKKHCAAAVTAFRKCLEIDGGMADAHFALATSLVALGEKKDAMEHFARAESLYPDGSPWKAKAAEMVRKLGGGSGQQ